MPGVLGTDAGSDLASLKMSAVRDGDCYVVNGQKTWNTLGNLANWCELLVRTDPHAPKHEGISCLLVDMARPGIEVRPLVTITGELGFNEIFFTDVRVPTSALLGEENEGWRVATTTLAYERGGVASLHLGLRAKIRRLLDEAKVTPMGDGRTAAQDPVVRQRLARVYLEGELLELIADRALSGAMHGRELGPSRASPRSSGARRSSISARSPATCSAPTRTRASGAAAASRCAPTRSPAAPPRRVLGLPRR